MLCQFCITTCSKGVSVGKQIYRAAAGQAKESEQVRPCRRRLSSSETPASLQKTGRAGSAAWKAHLDKERNRLKKRKRVLRAVSDGLFYTAIAVVLLAAVLLVANNQLGGNILGYSGFNVLSDSMQSVLPQGALVVVKHVDPDSIEKGDDITFLAGPGVVVTHRVTDILEDYEGAGVRGFVTQGVENSEPDAEVVYASNVVGVVVFCMSQLGAILTYVKANLWLVVALWGLFLLFSFSIRIFIGESKRDKAGKESKLEEQPAQISAKTD